ncbi:unnamed protein product [Brassica oleracea var. botrytis]
MELWTLSSFSQKHIAGVEEEDRIWRRRSEQKQHSQRGLYEEGYN